MNCPGRENELFEEVWNPDPQTLNWYSSIFTKDVVHDFMLLSPQATVGMK
jgi:hypothetical protein